MSPQVLRRSMSALLASLFYLFLITQAYAITVTGTLFSNTRWTKAMSPVILSGDLIVNTGVTLTIDPGVIVRAASTDTQQSGASTTKVELIVKGTLVVNGSATEATTFEGSSNTKSAWYGIIIETGATATLKYAKITNASYGLYSKGGTTTATNSHFTNNTTGVYATDGTTNITYSQLYKNGVGVEAGYSSTTATMTVDHCTIVKNSQYGVVSRRGTSNSGNYILRNSIVVNNGTHEIYTPTYKYGVTCTNNLIWANNTTSTIRNYYSPLCSANVIYNPLFVDEANDDYRIYDRSPARNAGTSASDLGALSWSTQKTNVLHGTLFVNTTLNAGTHVVKGDLVIASGVTLTLAPGASLQVEKADDMLGGSGRATVEINVKGSLIAESSTSQMIEFRAAQTTTAKAQWEAIYVESGGVLKFRKVKVQNASYGIHTRGGTTTVTDSQLLYNNTGAYATDGITNITYSQLYKNGVGVEAGYSSTTATMTVDHCTIVKNSQYGVVSRRGTSNSGNYILRNSIIVNNGTYEIYTPTYKYGVTCTNNLIWASNTTSTIRNYYSPLCSANVIYNPLFVDEANDDYRIYDRSPARKAGTSASDLGALSWSTQKTNVLHGTLFVNTTLNAGAHVVKGDLVVAPGVTLTLAPGASLQVEKADDMLGGSGRATVEINVKGTLVAKGGVPSSQVIEFRAAQTTTAKAQWEAIYVEKGGSLEFRNVKVQNASYGVYTRDGATLIDKSHFLHNNTGTYATGGTTNVTYSVFYKNGVGVEAGYSSTTATMTVDHCTIVKNSQYGVVSRRGTSNSGNYILRNSIIVNNGTYEIYTPTYKYGVTCTNNLIWASNTTSTIRNYYSPLCSANIKSNPLFVNEANDDFQLTATSPARKQASDGSDLGAYAYQPGLAQILVTPDPVSVQVGQSVQLKAEGYTGTGTVVSNLTFTWKVVNGGGTISNTGLFTAGTKAQQFVSTVEASSGSVKGFLTVTVTPGAPAKVVVSPATAKVKAGATTTFQAAVTDTYNNPITGATIVWSAGTSGSIASTGILTAATKAGTYKNDIKASVGAVSGTASVEIEPNTLSKITVSPNPGQVAPNKTIPFSAAGQDQYGNNISNVSYTWKMINNGGTVDPTGLVTAGASQGTYNNTVEASSGGIKGTATLIVKATAPQVASVEISPLTISLKPGGTQLFRAVAKDSNGKTVTGQSFTWSLPGGGGTYKQSGGLGTQATLTAGTKTGTFTIEAQTNGVKAAATFQVSLGQAPTIPTLQAPANKSSVKTAQPILEVNNSTDADGDTLTYEFEVALDAVFGQKVVSGNTPETTNVTRWKVSQALKEDTLYYWRARATDGTLQSGWSGVWSFRVNATNGPPTAPKLSFPVDGGQVATLTPALEVTNATDPENGTLTYRFELATDKAMSAGLVRSASISQGNGGSTSWKVSQALKDGTTYYWRAWAVDDEGLEGPKMAVASFSISLSNKPPSAPQARSPKDGDTVTTLKPTFEVINGVDPEGEAVTLDIEVDTKKTFDSADKIATNDLPQDSAGITSWTLGQELQENGTYFWRVRASDGKATTSWVFGGEFKVNSQNDPPTAPTLRAPADQTTLDETAITLEVTNATDPDGDTLTYHFQIAEDKDFQGQLEEQTGVKEGKAETKWAPPTLARGKTYYWRVRANDGQEDGPWSEVFSLTIKADTGAGEKGGTENPAGSVEKVETDGGPTPGADKEGSTPEGPLSDTFTPNTGCSCDTTHSGSWLTGLLCLFLLLPVTRRS